MTWKSIAMCAAPLALFMIGCGSGSGGDAATKPAGTTTAETPTKGTDKKELKITMIAKSSNNPVFQSARLGAEAAAKELGDKTGRTITID